MSSIDVESLLAELSPDAPCGEDLEYDAEMGEMERATEPKPEQEYGDTLVPAEPPDWKSVKKLCLSLLTRTKDMRVVVQLGRAVLHEDGIVEFADTMSVLRGYVEQYWDSVHPELDPDDDNDPTFRMNTLSTLADGSTLQLLRQAALVKSRALGWFGLREVEAAKEAAEGPSSAPASGGAWADDESGGSEEESSSGPTLQMIEAAFKDVEPEEIEATAAAITTAKENIETIETTVTAQVGAANAVSLGDLTRMLGEMDEIVAEQMKQRGIGVVDEEPDEEGDGEAGGAGGDGAAGGGSGGGKRLSGDILSRDDAIRALDKVCEYYERHEPSSPLPLLIRRAQRLATKSFIDIIRDLAPDALAQAEAIGGVADGGGGGGGGSESSSDDSW